MDLNSLLLALLFGTVGMGFIIYAKNAAKLVPAFAGIALAIFPYFVTNLWVMGLVGLALTAVPFIFRDT